MHADSLTDRIHNCLTQAQFTDFYRRRFNASEMRQLHEANHSCLLLSTDAIDVCRSDLDALVSDLVACLGAYQSSVSGAVGNGLYLLMGTSGSPKLPSVVDYAKILVLAAARIGAARTAKFVTGWLNGSLVPFRSCAVLTGVETNEVLDPVTGLRLETLSPTLDFPSSTIRLDQYGMRLQELEKRTIFTVEYETIPGFYNPETFRRSFPPVTPRTFVNPALKRLTLSRFCQALSLEVNNYVDWFEQWNDHADVEAFSLQPNYSRIERDVRSRSTVDVTAEQILACVDMDARVNESKFALPVARWMRSKKSLATYEQLVELRIALEAAFLNDDKRGGEKSHRLALRGAWFLGETLEERRTYFDVLKSVYNYASAVIHGDIPNSKKRDMDKDIALAQDLCRDAILRMVRQDREVDWSDVVLGIDN